MQAEIIALRHQLTVLQRTHRPKRLVLKRGDRCLWVWLSRLWSGWRSALLIVKPQTVIAWHRQGFRRYTVVLLLLPSIPPSSVFGQGFTGFAFSAFGRKSH